MKVAARYQLAIEILESYDPEKGPLLDFAKAYLRGKRFAGSKDRRAIIEIVLNSLRYRDFLINQKADLSGMHARVRAFVLSFAISRNLRIEDIFSGEDYAPSPLYQEEKHLLEKLKHVRFKTSDLIPLWLIELLENQFRAKPLDYEGYLSKKPVQIVVDPRCEGALLRDLKSSPILALPLNYSSSGYELEGKINPRELEKQLQGRGIIQNQGSQIIAALVDPKPKERILDLCAGAGGKSITMTYIEPDIDLNLYDRDPKRLAKAKSRLKDLKLFANYIEDADRLNYESYDKILIDAPCSGTGTLSKTPEFSLLMNPQKLVSLINVQKQLICKAYDLLKPGGEIIYATCSILEEENEAVIEAILQDKKFKTGLKKVPIKSRCDRVLKSELKQSEIELNLDTLTLRPDHEAFDGFKITILQKAMGSS